MRYAVLVRGRVRIPADVLAQAGIAPGSLVRLELDGERIVVRQVGEASEEALADERPH